MAKRPATIPDSELDVLRVLWERQQATVREVLETLRAAGREWSYATVATLLDRLETKGVVTSDRSDLALDLQAGDHPAGSPAEAAQEPGREALRESPGCWSSRLLQSRTRSTRSRPSEVRSLLDEMTASPRSKD